MMKAFALSLASWVAMTTPALAHTGEVLKHDLLHTVMNHDGSMSTELMVSGFVAAIAVLGIGFLRSRKKG